MQNKKNSSKTIANDFFERIPSEEEDRYTDVSSPYKINSYGADFTLSVLYQKLTEGEIIIPDFQRGYVWDKRRASRLIESFLLSIPVPPVFVFRETKTQKLLVVDGNQRLRTIQFFIGGKFFDSTEFHLTGVQTKWEGKTYNELSKQDQIKLKDSILRTVIFEQNDLTDNSSMYQIFERLNTETAPLRDQEIRNALYRGPFNDLLKGLNEYDKWRKLIGKNTPLPRMRDVEMILRFLALYYNIKAYSKPMKQFLNDFMNDRRYCSKVNASMYENLFKKTMDLIYEGLGTQAFRIKSGINVALFDALCVGIAEIHPSLTSLKSAKEKLLKNKQFIEAVEKHTTDKDKIIKRISISKRILNGK